MRSKARRVSCAALTLASLWPASARAGRIVVAHDEWTLSDTGFVDGVNDPGVFATNVAEWFTGGGTGSFMPFRRISG